MTDDTDCPVCGEAMRWKYLKAPRCMKCEPPKPEELSENEKLRRRIHELEARLSDAEHGTPCQEIREKELEDENTRLRSAAQVAFLTPVSVKPDSPEAEELQVIYDELGEALNWKQESEDG